MEPKSRGLDELGPEPALAPRASERTERPIAAAEDAREEAEATARERDSPADALRRSEAELRRRDAEMATLRARLAAAEAALEAKDAAGPVTAEELGVAMEELRASAVSLVEANASLLRLSNDLERRVAERTAALAESETRLRAATDAVPHLVWTSDADGLWTWANRRWVEYTGMSSAEASGMGWLGQVHPDDREATLAAWRNAEDAGELRVEHRLRAADGTYR